MKIKRGFFVLVLLSAGIAAQAQTMKIGYADVEYIFSQLPEAKRIESTLQSHNSQLQKQLQAKIQEYQIKVDAYQQGAAGMTETDRANKENELLQMQQNIQKFEQDAQTSLQQKQLELMQPVYEKVGTTIEAVAKENGYTYILSATIGGADVVLFADDKNDISDLVLKKLGITPTN